MMTATDIPSPPEGQDLATVPLKFEVVRIPITDFERAKDFYQRLGWQLDIDFQFTEQVRAVQFTPPGSPASVQFGQGLTTMTPGSLEGLLLVVEDIDAAREELIGRDVEVSEVWHLDPAKGRVPGPHPLRQSYRSRASFSDPDGNQWQLQEVTERLPGRG
jgi:catechol 2,3-dioxygenase-like lactoylglutathione lyase family enzyme